MHFFFVCVVCTLSCSPGRPLNYMHVQLLMLLRMSIYMAEVAGLLVMKIENVNGSLTFTYSGLSKY